MHVDIKDIGTRVDKVILDLNRISDEMKHINDADIENTFWHNGSTEDPKENIPLLFLVSGVNGGEVYDLYPTMGYYNKKKGYVFYDLIEYKDSDLHCNYFAYIPSLPCDTEYEGYERELGIELSYKPMKEINRKKAENDSIDLGIG